MTIRQRPTDEMGTTAGILWRPQSRERPSHSGSRRHNRKGRRDILGRVMLSSSSWCLMLVLLLSSVFQTRGFMPNSGTSAASNYLPVTPMDQPQPQCSSSALGMFSGGSNSNNNSSSSSSNNKKGDDNDGEWFKKLEILKFIKRIFTKRNEMLENLKASHGTEQPQQSDDENQSTDSESSSTAPMIPTSQFFQPMGIRESNPPVVEHAFDSFRNHNIFNWYNDDEEEIDDEEDDDDLPAGTTLLFKIPAKQLKPGGLRLFLMFYLMGMQNTPDRNTWRADQRLMSSNSATPKGYGSDDDDDEPEEKNYVLEMLYDKDRSGMLQIELLPAGNGKRNGNGKRKRKQAQIRIYRCGSRPSTSYLMQESVIVDGVLDELQNISGEKDHTRTIPRGDGNRSEDDEKIADEDRLLITIPPNAIEAARETLAFS